MANKKEKTLESKIEPKTEEGLYPSWWPERTTCPDTGIHISQWMQEKAKKENAERVEAENKAARKSSDK